MSTSIMIRAPSGGQGGLQKCGQLLASGGFRGLLGQPLHSIESSSMRSPFFKKDDQAAVFLIAFFLIGFLVGLRPFSIFFSCFGSSLSESMTVVVSPCF
jgi:hypothetical protein